MGDAGGNTSPVSAGRGVWGGKRFIIAGLVISAALAAVFFPMRGKVSIEGDPRADAEAALREEIGTAALENVVMYIPSEEVPLTDLAMRVGRYFVALDGAASYLVKYDCPTTATPSVWRSRIARLPEDRARAIIVALRFILDAKGRDYITTGNRSPEWSYYWEVHPNINNEDEHLNGDVWHMLEAVRARTACRYMDKVAKEAVFLDDGALIAALARESLTSSVRKGECFRPQMISRALDYIADFPDEKSLPVLRKMSALAQGTTIAQRIQNVPFAGRLAKGLLPRQTVSDVTDALRLVGELAGKSDAERARILTREVFQTPGQGPGYYGLDSKMHAFARTQPAEFVKTVAANWNSMSTGERSYIVEFMREQYDVEPIAKLAAADADPALRAQGIWTLAWAWGGHAYAGAFLETLPAFDSLDATNLLAADKLYSKACEINSTHDETTEVAEFFARQILSTPPDSKVWRLLMGYQPMMMNVPGGEEDFAKSLRAICATLARVGGPESAAALMHVVRCYGNEPFKNDEGKPVMNERGWPPFNRDALQVELIASRDSFLDDAMYEYLKATKPNRYGLPFCEVFITALGTKGDSRLIPLLEPIVEKTLEDEKAGRNIRIVKMKPGAPHSLHLFQEEDIEKLPALTYEPDAGFCDRALKSARFAASTDPVGWLIQQPPDFYNDILDPCAIRLLSQRLTASELEALLADERAEKLRGAVYVALLKRREMERK